MQEDIKLTFLPASAVWQPHPGVFLAWHSLEDLQKMPSDYPSLQEQREFEALTSSKRQKEWRGSRRLLKALIQKLEPGIAPSDIELRPLQHGQPPVLSLRGKPSEDISATLSHSNTLVCVVVSRSRRVLAGCDVQPIATISERTQARVFTEAERSRIEATKSPQLTQTILWSLKEAAFKTLRQEHFLPWAKRLSIELPCEPPQANQPILIRLDGGASLEGYFRLEQGEVLACVVRHLGLSGKT